MGFKCFWPLFATLLFPGLSAPYTDGASHIGFPESQVANFWFGHPGNALAVTHTVQITATDDQFLPGNVEVRAGETVRFEITNRGTLRHEFVLGDVDEQQAHDKEMKTMPNMPMDDPNGISVGAGKTAALIWTFTHAGALQYACHVPGHYAAGMFGRLNIQEARPRRSQRH